MELWIGALNLGFLYAFMTMGVFVTFRIHDFPDITVDGSFTSGAAATAVLIAVGFNPLAALLAGLLIGMAAGAITAWIHARLNINGLLAGILVMTGLYSVNLHIMGRSNIPLLNQTTLFTWIQKTNPGMHAEVWISCVLCAILAVFWLGVSVFFKTDLGLSMRATGGQSGDGGCKRYQRQPDENPGHCPGKRVCGALRRTGGAVSGFCRYRHGNRVCGHRPGFGHYRRIDSAESLDLCQDRQCHLSGPCCFDG